MIGLIAGLILKRRPGLTEPYARMIAKTILGVIAFIAFVLFALHWIQAERNEAVDAYKVEVVNKAVAAREKAGDQRTIDVIADHKTEGDLKNAIENAPPSDAKLHPAARALACERLRHANRIPAPCRSPDGDGSKTLAQ